LVGEVSPYSDQYEDALALEPRGASGNRLRLLLGMTDEEYLAGFTRTNLCRRVWDKGQARERAWKLRTAYDGRFILLGRKVAASFDLAYQPFVTNGRFLVLPHPSGLNQSLDAAGVRSLLRAVVRGMIEQETGGTIA
jgi:hypothetical protein